MVPLCAVQLTASDRSAAVAATPAVWAGLVKNVALPSSVAHVELL